MLKRKKQIIAKVMATTMLASTLTIDVSAADPRAIVSETSIAGGNRYKTAVEISKNYTSTSNHAIIVNSENGIVDALTATPYASLKKAPILITQSTTLNSDTKLELLRREIKTVDIVGGTKSVSDSVKSQIESLGITVNRIAGINKYETALKVAKEIDKISDISEIAVTSGEVLADAVSVAAPAAQNKMPIILVHPTKGLDSDTKAYIDGESISTSYVIGGTTSISDPIKNSLPGTKERLSGGAGTGRQETNAAVVKKFYTSSSYYNVYVAKSGQVNKADEIVDALAVGVLAASKQEPVILVGNSLVSAQKTLLEGKEIEKITKVGDGIPTASINAIKNTQKDPEKDPEATISTVKLIDSKTIEISGSELNRIGKTDVSITGNTVVSYTATSDGKKATVVFANVFSNGANTVKVKSNLGNETSHSFTFDSAISSVEGTSSEIYTDGLQHLTFTVNGGVKRTIKELKEIGWSVKFKSSERIFYDGSTSSKESIDGKLKTSIDPGQTTPFKEGKTYTYEVILTKGEEEVKSKLQSIKVVKSQYKEINSFDFKLTNGVKVVNNKLALGDVVSISNIKVTDSKGDIITTQSSVLTSEDNSIIAVRNNKLEPQKSGTTNIVIKTGNATKKITMTVGEEPRKVNTVTLSNPDLNVTTGATINLQATIKDQYDAAFKGSNLINTSEQNIFELVKDKISTNSTVGTIKAENASTTEGTVDIVVKATTTTGTAKEVKGRFEIKDANNKKFATLNINISKDVSITNLKLETQPGVDKTLDLYTEVTKDNTVIVNLNGYNKDGRFVTTMPTITTQSSTAAKPTAPGVVLVYNNNNVNISVGSSNITLTANTKGSTTITPWYNGVEQKKGAMTITVNNTTPEMTGINLKEIDTIKTTKTLDIVKDIFETTQIIENNTTKTILKEISGNNGIKSREVLMTTGGSIFIQEDSGNITTIGNVKIVTDINGLDTSNLSNISITSTGDEKKYILVKVFKGNATSGNPIATRVINIKVK